MGERFVMQDGGLQERSERLADRVEALAVALRESGVSEEAATRLLAHASTAVLHALTLETLLAPEPSTAPAVEPRAPAAPEVPLAA
ncbi:MAG TPA: hypothetical protein VFA37_09695 [Gaiellaceae bacterium]|nr:hypothetical protein [Gaiellaceae bacterium]